MIPHPGLASGRGRSDPTTEVGSRSPALAGTSPPVPSSTTSASPTSGSGSRLDGRDGRKDTTLVLQPATIIEGRVPTADTDQPIPNAAINLSAGSKEVGGWYATHFLADDQGRFTVNPSPGAYFRISAFPAKDQPYLVPEYKLAWTKGSVKKVMDIKLPRGVLIRGKVIEQGISRPVAGAPVQYLAARNLDNVLDGWQGVVVSENDGSFRIVVSPGKGHLFVYGPTSGYILE